MQECSKKAEEKVKDNKLSSCKVVKARVSKSL